MSNVFSNTNFAVLSVMVNEVDNNFVGATAFVQRKPEADHGNIMTVSFAAADFNIKDFHVQDRFNANVATNIHAQILDSASENVNFTSANSNISVKSYRMTAVENT